MEEICRSCDLPIDPDHALGLCPRCVLSTAVDGLNQTDHPSLSRGQNAGRLPSLDDLNTQVAGFKFIELLGRGGSGWTFLALQKTLNRQVAVKVMHRDIGNEDAVTSFRCEAESLAKLNHPRIVTVHDFGVSDSFMYLVMEYVAGPTLRQRLIRRPLTVPQSMEVASQICAGVQCAHQAGVLHRDIKPENILFESNDAASKIKVADFGIAKLLNGTREESMTFTGVVAGTPFYMAPEQNHRNDPVGPRSDVYSIGVVVYEMLTGHLPLGRFPAPSKLVDCSRSIDIAVFQALQSQTDARTPSVQRLAAQLDADSGPAQLLKAGVMGLAAIVMIACAIVFLWATNFGDDAGTGDKSTVESSATLEPVDPPVVEENPFLRNWPVELP